MTKPTSTTQPPDLGEFTEAEVDELFGSKWSGRLRRRPRRLNKKAMAQSDAPFLSDPKDRAYIKPKQTSPVTRRNSTKVLTTRKPKRIVLGTIKRKDGKMAVRQKVQTNYMQTIAVSLLAIGAILGAADLLGGGLRACMIAALLVACLFVMAIDYRK